MKHFRSLLSCTLFLLFFTIHSLGANCHIDPFPPYPPSPPEFREPLKVSKLSQGVLVSWQGLRNHEGYLISVCSDETGAYIPVGETTVEQFLLTGLPAQKSMWVQVRAFVKVDEAYVFNGGVISSFQTNANRELELKQTDQKKPELASQKVEVALKAEVEPVSYNVIEQMSSRFPDFSGSVSFYSPDYPQVRNPFTPQAAQDGSQIPALLTDAGITQTVNRVRSIQLSRDKKSNAEESVKLASSKVVNPSSNANAVNSENGSGVSVPEGQQGSVQQTSGKNQVTSGKSTSTIPNGGRDSDSNSSQESQESSSQLHVYILVGFLVLAFIYLVFYKEAK